MSGRITTVPPAVLPLEVLEASADRVRAQLETLLEEARDHYRLIQDAEAEASDGVDMGVVFARRYVAREEIAALNRQLARAHALLITPKDPRAGAARQVLGYLDDDEQRRAA
jgi:hypothetical protein